MNLLEDVSPVTEDGSLVRVLIECQKGSVHKYEYDPRGVLTVVRDLDKRFKYPFDYGCVPNTLAGDNDALDAIVISEESYVPTTILNCRVVGLIKMIDNGEEDNKLVCVPYYSNIRKIKLKKILKYLNSYKHPYQNGTEITGIFNSEEAWKEINTCVERQKWTKSILKSQ